VNIRPIQPQDNPIVAEGIREAYEPYGCTGAGFSPTDAEMDDLCGKYSQAGHGYFVFEQAGRVLGGAGFGPHGPAEESTCELRKLYLHPDSRGHGAGEAIMLHTLQVAREQGYSQCYLETVTQMSEATGLYLKHGFQELDEPMFGGGHHSCDKWYLKSLLALLLCCFVVLPACAGPRIPETTEAIGNAQLRYELMSMQLEAEDLRERLIEIGITNLRLSDVYAQEALQHKQVDRLKEIVARHGWPSRDLVGTDGAHAAFQVIQYADHDPIFQAEALELMESLWRTRQVDPADYAWLTDRVRVQRGLPQLYGTQASIVLGQLQFAPIQDTAGVDQRRASVGLDPLAEYRRQLERAHLIRTN